MDDCPCKECSKRNEICHAICKQYKSWEKLNAEKRENQRQQRVIDDAMREIFKSRNKKYPM